MTRGTIVLFGQLDREIEILRDRLAKEQFAIESVTTLSDLAKFLRRDVPQAMVVTHHVRAGDAKRAIAWIHRRPSTKWTPVMIAAHDDVPSKIMKVRGIGEVWRLHVLPLARIVPRLKLAIQLGQLAKTHNHARMM